MKTPKIKYAALAAAILAGTGMAYGNEYSDLQVVYCKVRIVEGENDPFVSVTLPPTEGYYDSEGNPLTYWNVGTVPAGGVADSWHGEGGPGRFTARNAGNVGAYLYVTTSGLEYNAEGIPGVDPWMTFTQEDRQLVFGEFSGYLKYPSISPRELRRWGLPDAYHLAFTTDTMAKVPTWHSLDHWRDGMWHTDERDDASDMMVSGYMGYVDAGDYLTFDLKFWASPKSNPYMSYMFTFCVEASSFPLWEHGRAGE